MKANLQMYNYRIQHVKEKTHYFADVLSRRPVWINLDSSSGPEEGLDLDEDEDYVMRVMVSKPHLIKDNPLLSELEDMGRKAKEYHTITNVIRTGA